MCSRTLIALSLLALSACSTTPVAPRVLLDPPPANVLEPCPPPELLQEARPVLMGEMAEADVDLAFLYHACAARQHALARWVREAVQRLQRKP